MLASVLALWARPARADPSDLTPEVGYNYGETETPRIAATGGALRAFAHSVDSLFVNPAGMASSRVYHIGALAQIWPEAARQSYGAGAVDSIVSSSRLAGGLGGAWTRQDPEGIDRRSTDLRVALAYPFSDQFCVGAGIRYMWLKQNGDGPLGDSPASGGLDGKNIIRGITLDTGLTLRLADSFAIGLVGNNLGNPGTGFRPTSFGGGVGFGTEDFTLEADALADFTTWDKSTLRAMGGFEFLAADHYPLRLGYRYDEGAASHAASGGLGYIDRMFEVGLAVRRVVSGEVATAVVFGFTYHLESTRLTPSPADTF